MPLSIAKAEIDDLPTIIDLEFTTFYASSPVGRLIYPNGLTPFVTAGSLNAEKFVFDEPDSHHLKVVDSDLAASQEGKPLLPGDDGGAAENRGGIIAYARYKLWREDRKAEEWDTPYYIPADRKKLDTVPDTNLRVQSSFRSQQKELSRAHIRGRKCVCKFLVPT